MEQKGIKAADIARRLNVSKASVSLALNDKPGISDALRQRILACKKQMEEEPDHGTSQTSSLKDQKSDTPLQPDLQSQIAFLTYLSNQGILRQEEASISAHPMQVIERQCRENGYGMSCLFAYENTLQETIISILANPNNRALVVMGTDLDVSQMPLFQNLPIPLLMIDQDPGDQGNCSLLDNYDVGKLSVKKLKEIGCQNIWYAANERNLYNFKERRAGFCHEIEKYIPSQGEEKIFKVGRDIQQMKDGFRSWLGSHSDYDGFICENNQVGIAISQVLAEEGIKPGQDVSLICIDEIEPYLSGNIKLACWKLDHEDRFMLAVDLLCKEIEKPMSHKLKLVSRSRFLPGQSLKKN